MIESEWDANKAAENFAKHGVSFEEAGTVFYDLNAQILEDEMHSDGEQRFTIIGYGRANRMLVVIYTERNEKVRLISARVPEKHERRIYEE